MFHECSGGLVLAAASMFEFSGDDFVKISQHVEIVFIGLQIVLTAI